MNSIDAVGADGVKLKLATRSGARGTVGSEHAKPEIGASEAIGASQNWSSLRVIILAICFLLNAIDGMDVVILSYIAPALSADWALSPERLGVVFSASLAGMVIGCFFVAPLADRWGRRPLTITALSAITVAMILSGFVTAVMELVVLRFFIGVWIGAILASMAALAAEFAPVKERSFAVAVMTAGYPLGAVFTGLAMAPLLPVYGWHMMLIGAGLASLIVLPFVWFFLPESLDFLVRKQPKNALQRTNHVLAKLGMEPVKQLPQKSSEEKAAGFATIFTENRLVPTIWLWVGIFMGFLSLYFVISWVTKLASQAGLTLENAIYVGAILNFGAFLGTLLMGKLSNRFPQGIVGAVFLVLAAALLVVFGTVHMSLGIVLFTAFLMGMAIYGGFNSFYGLAASLYPAAVRGTGVGWAMGAGRFGAVVGPSMGGVLIGSGASLSTVMIVFAVPLLIAAIAALYSRAR